MATNSEQARAEGLDWTNDEAVVRAAGAVNWVERESGRIVHGSYRWDDWHSARKNDPTVQAFERQHNPALQADPVCARAGCFHPKSNHGFGKCNGDLEGCSCPSFLADRETTRHGNCPACARGQSSERGEGTHLLGTVEHPEAKEQWQVARETVLAVYPYAYCDYSPIHGWRVWSKPISAPYETRRLSANAYESNAWLSAAANLPAQGEANTQVVTLYNDTPHAHAMGPGVACTGPCCHPELYASGIKGSQPTVPAVEGVGDRVSDERLDWFRYCQKVEDGDYSDLQSVAEELQDHRARFKTPVEVPELDEVERPADREAAKFLRQSFNGPPSEQAERFSRRMCLLERQLSLRTSQLRESIAREKEAVECLQIIYDGTSAHGGGNDWHNYPLAVLSAFNLVSNQLRSLQSGDGFEEWLEKEHAERAERADWSLTPREEGVARSAYTAALAKSQAEREKAIAAFQEIMRHHGQLNKRYGRPIERSHTYATAKVGLDALLPPATTEEARKEGGGTVNETLEDFGPCIVCGHPPRCHVTGVCADYPTQKTCESYKPDSRNRILLPQKENPNDRS